MTEKNKRKAEKNAGTQLLFFSVLDTCGLPRPTPELKFHPTRGWRFDYAWPEQMIALEVEGGIFVGGRHSGGMGMKNDFTKYNEAAALGWRIIKVVPKELLHRSTMQLIRRVLYF